ncbi:MAG: YdcF family protein [Ruminococcaceae bacterium]|nr:YdcF family protein [Oscillospiraceae bacterium]
MSEYRWAILPVILIIAAGVFNFAMTGHGYFALALMVIAAILVFYHFAGNTVKIVGSIILALGFLLFIILEIPIIKHAKTDAEADSEYVIVLGAGLRGTVPSLSLQNRMQGAYDWLIKHPDCIAIVSGGQGKGEDITEASAMKLWLTKKGIAADRIIEEGESFSTAENIENSMAIIKEQGGSEKSKIALITSEYHLYRAKMIARDAGLNVKGVAAKTTMPTLMINYFIRESVGVLHYWIFGS